MSMSKTCFWKHNYEHYSLISQIGMTQNRMTIGEHIYLKNAQRFESRKGLNGLTSRARLKQRLYVKNN